MIEERQLVKLSKRLSKVLRHDPASVGVWLTDAVPPEFLT
ncbi:RNA:NAD 2'-phosphotransferase (TPT1/KptA family) [Amycolatopsis magusensis]|uniref:RNA:NAD 2'-phosphotransferase (TPT1/KptA family) n=1 Tax=Amycolatopsis magusensis TaxID=882444 RepID=A0ABS4Q3I2_9PSEU|nr:RNA:NAD 2'-phosphotransferase (TPT1/KptA family) [Amycolatopsis magusensis]